MGMWLAWLHRYSALGVPISRSCCLNSLPTSSSALLTSIVGVIHNKLWKRWPFGVPQLLTLQRCHEPDGARALSAALKHRSLSNGRRRTRLWERLAAGWTLSQCSSTSEAGPWAQKKPPHGAGVDEYSVYQATISPKAKLAEVTPVNLITASAVPSPSSSINSKPSPPVIEVR